MEKQQKKHFDPVWREKKQKKYIVKHYPRRSNFIHQQQTKHFGVLYSPSMLPAPCSRMTFDHLWCSFISQLIGRVGLMPQTSHLMTCYEQLKMKHSHCFADDTVKLYGQLSLQHSFSIAFCLFLNGWIDILSIAEGNSVIQLLADTQHNHI